MKEQVLPFVGLVGKIITKESYCGDLELMELMHAFGK